MRRLLAPLRPRKTRSHADEWIEVALAEGVQLVRLVRHPRARRLTLRVDRVMGEVRVTLPARFDMRDAAQFVRLKQDWIADRLSEAHGRHLVENGVLLPFRSQDIRIHWAMGLSRNPRIEPGDEARLVFGGPENSVPRRVQNWLKAQCLDLSRTDLAHYCTKAGHETPKLAVSSAQRRWGSCSSAGVIRVNWRLAMAPDWVRKSVVAHEVAHLTHMDHSPRFYDLLDSIYEYDRRKADAWLKRYGPTLYAWDFG